MICISYDGIVDKGCNNGGNFWGNYDKIIRVFYLFRFYIFVGEKLGLNCKDDVNVDVLSLTNSTKFNSHRLNEFTYALTTYDI